MKTYDFTLLTKAEILKISINSPEKLFKEVMTERELKDAFIKLSFKWHPDKNLSCKESTDTIFAHISLLYKNAKEKFKNNTWNKGFFKEFISNANKSTMYQYIQEVDFELGHYYIAADSIAWVIASDYQDLAINAIEHIENIKYANDKMKTEMQKFVPQIKQFITTKDNLSIIVMARDPDAILLKDVLSYFSNAIEPKHVAWIMSNCYNIACFLQYNKIMHGGLTLDSLFINPQTHAAQILGGWWFTHTQNDRLVALSTQTLDIAPFDVINTKKAMPSLDLESIRLLGRQMLGDKNGLSLVKNKTIPAPLTNWVRGASTHNAFKEYEIWHNVLKDSFGVRRFIKMELTSNDVYN